MKILFVFPNISDPGYKLVGVSTLSALAKKAGHETALFDTSFMDTSSISKVKHFKSNNAIGEEILNFKPITDTQVHDKKKMDLKSTFLSKVVSFKPDILAVSCLSTEWYLSQLILDFTKEYDPSIFTIVGGRHCIADPEGTIAHPSVNAICVGEGELAFMRLLEALEKGEADALQRAQAYIEAGADGIMIHSKSKTPDEILGFCKAFHALERKVPLVVVPSTYHSITEEELEAAGVKIVIYANHLLRSAYPNMVRAAESLLTHHRALEADEWCMPIKEILTLIPDS